MKRLRQYVQEKVKKNPEFATHLEEARAEVRLSVAMAHLREQRGMSQRDLARATGIKQPQIARLEKGNHFPTVGTISRLLSALGGRMELGPKGALTIRTLSVTRKITRPSFLKHRSSRRGTLVRTR